MLTEAKLVRYPPGVCSVVRNDAHDVGRRGEPTFDEGGNSMRISSPHGFLQITVFDIEVYVNIAALGDVISDHPNCGLVDGDVRQENAGAVECSRALR
jgi:hypothetical protein